MWREQRRVARFAWAEPFDVVGQQALQKAGRILAAYANDGAILEHGGFLVHGEGSGRACKVGHCQIGRFCATARKIAMPPSFDCVLMNGTVVNQDGVGLRDIGVRDGRIAEIGALSHAVAGERIDCRGLHILPGVIDSQVHFREPGLVHKEDLETGSRAAVLGGVTAVFEMPNTDPLTTSADALADKLARAKGRMHCDFAFWVGGTHDNVADIPELERLPGAAGIKVFMGSSTGRLLVADDEGVLAILKQTRRRAAFHSEDEARLERAQTPARRGRSVLASGLARRDCGFAFDRAARSPRAPRRARKCTCCISRRARRWSFWPAPRMSRAARRRRII